MSNVIEIPIPVPAFRASRFHVFTEEERAVLGDAFRSLMTSRMKDSEGNYITDRYDHSLDVVEILMIENGY